MPVRLSILKVITILFAIISLSCSAATQSPTSPGAPDSAQLSDGGNTIQPGHQLWAFYKISRDPVSGEIIARPFRGASDHWNVLKWLEKGPCTNCVRVVGGQDLGTAYPKFDIQITHPFGSKNLTGFDVRGIAMFNGTMYFPDSKVIVSESTNGDAQLLNRDGYTTLYSWGTEGKGPGGAQGYLKGKLAKPIAPNGTLNGYKRFVSAGAGNTRNAFNAADKITVTYEMYWPQDIPSLGYAVDASWMPPTTKPVTDPQKDFPPQANSPEPWKITYWATDEITDVGGTSHVEVTIYDYDGKSSYKNPLLEAPDLFDGQQKMGWVSDGPGYSVWAGTIINDNLPLPGYYHFLVSVQDNNADKSPSWINLTSYVYGGVWVRRVDGWVGSWGGPQGDTGTKVKTGPDGSIYVAGSFFGDTFDYIDFDPSTNAAGHISNGKVDAYLSKFSADGKFQWAVSWGGNEDDYANDLVVDATSVKVVGNFKNTVDFDPGSGVASSDSVGNSDCFLVAFDSNDGSYKWHSTWGGDSVDVANGVSESEDGQVFVGGHFLETADFDPGSGVDNRTAGLWTPAGYLVSYDGNTHAYQWVNSWGAETGQASVYVYGVECDTWGNPFVSGGFASTVDFNPSADTDQRTSKGGYDAYLVGFWKTGEYRWVNAWGGTDNDYGTNVLNGDSSDILVLGSFISIVDFDPGTGTSEATSNGGADAYIVSYATNNGNIQWVRTWGSSGTDYATDAAIGYYTDHVLYVSGYFQNAVDFDPGSGVDMHASNGFGDMFVLKFDTLGPPKYTWVRTYGSADSDDYGQGVVVDSVANVIATGSFYGTTDFDPLGDTGQCKSNGSNDAFLLKLRVDGMW